MTTRTKNLTTLSAIRFSPALHQHATQVARACHMNLSTFARIAIQEKLDAYVRSRQSISQ